MENWIPCGTGFKTGGGAFAHRFDVASSAESAARAGQDDATHVVVVAQTFERLKKAGANVHGKRVKPLRPVQCQRGNAICDGLDQVGHVVLQRNGFVDLGVTGRCLQH